MQDLQATYLHHFTLYWSPTEAMQKYLFLHSNYFKKQMRGANNVPSGRTPQTCFIDSTTASARKPPPPPKEAIAGKSVK